MRILEFIRAGAGRALGISLVISQTATLAGCAANHEPALPAAAEYERSCADLIAAYERVDIGASNRKAMSRSADFTIAATSVIVAFATAGQLGMGLPLGAIALQQAKGDMGYAKKAQEREALRALAVRKGCTQEDVQAREAARSRSVQATEFMAR
jgi:hypothetical protein